MKFEIVTDEDTSECELCGTDWAQGGKVYVDGELIIDAPAHAHCYSGSSWDAHDLLVMALRKLGHEVLEDGWDMHVCSVYTDEEGNWTV